MKNLLLIDGNSMLFRAYYATLYGRRMSTASGIPTNAVYGFINMINKAIDKIQPDALLVAWDTGKPTFRHKQYEEYKGTRKELDEDLITQMPLIREFLDDAHIERYEQEGYEADDIIGSTAKGAPDIKTTILTSDKDLLQLIDPTTDVLLMKKGLEEMEVMNEAAFEEHYGLKPIQMIDLKGLMGDASDNIPGVKGVGEKTALKLLHQYGSVEGVYEHIDEQKGKLKEKLENDKEKAFLSKELATIYTQMHLPYSIEDLAYNQDEKGTADFYQKYEMKSLLQAMSTKKKPGKETFEVIEVESFKDLNPAEFKGILMPAADLKPFMEQKLYGFLFIQKDKIAFLPHEKAISDEDFIKYLKTSEALSSWDVKVTMHLLDRYGYPMPKFKEDLHLAAFLLYSQATSEEALIEALEIPTPFPWKDLTKKTLGADSKEKIVPYMAAVLEGLGEKQDEILKEIQKEDMEKLYREVELPLVPILYEMEKTGVLIDIQKLKELKKEFGDKLDELSTKIFSYASAPFKLESPKQLGNFLYDELGLKAGGKKRSTAAEVLEKIKDSHPVIPLILEWRKYSKLMTTYIEGLSKHILNGRIHTTFNQTMTQTGRLSSSDPNLQNISVKTEEGRKIREIFIADPDERMISADYSQIELRILAHMANEQIMLETFKNGVDIHRRTASEIFGVSDREVTDAQRRIAKTVNFGIIYGQTDFGLAQELDISRAEAKEFMNTYFSTYPNIHRYMNKAIEECKEKGYAETMLHRRRAIPEINDKNYMVREFGKRAAMNAPIQGSAADLIKIAMIKMAEALKEHNLKSRMLLQIHDELIFDVPEDEIETMEKLVQEVMDHAMELNVPLEASVHCGYDWAEAK